jgi:hypothetical protein
MAAGFFHPTQPEDIAIAIVRLFRDADYRAALIKNGYQLASERTPEAYAQVAVRTLDEFAAWRRNWPPDKGVLPPSAVQRFPDDLVNEGSFYSGVFDDGWLSERSFFILQAPAEGITLSVRGEIPYIEAAGYATVLSITVDGLLLAQPELYPGKFEVSVKPPGRHSLHLVELAFTNLQQIPEPDGRRVGAKLDFVGFDDDTTKPAPSS